jgi:hypothetical protein
MNDAQKTVNLLEPIEFLLEAIAGELKVARMDRGPAPEHGNGMDRYNALQEVEASLNALEVKRRESMEEPKGFSYAEKLHPGRKMGP